MSAAEEGGPLVVFVTTSTVEEAARIARTLVEERLAACGNVVGGVRSIYRWEDKIEDDPEALLILKTRRALFYRLQARVAEIHSYHVPEIIAVPVEAGYAPYLVWIKSST
ncbi:MAG TPA: divalent-cation tolerance protein CutA [Candidatus Glassbacteria bacterium]|nr:divalent-cation tolerance protein CutA [Candidatus Glassbacteria bacterium]